MEKRFGSANTKRIRRRICSSRPWTPESPLSSFITQAATPRSFRHPTSPSPPLLLPLSISPWKRSSSLSSLYRQILSSSLPSATSSRHLRSETLSLLSPPWNPLSQSPLSNPVHSRRKKGFQMLPKNACSRLPGRN
ncbi:hypothetical protein MRB53_022035 [Persea americana]|uniref:Uncharacterized protein n=1 Tax=Persea americana TaxID=3435 RepID=A0ACC2L6K0_PERAE|nr:hypothetical protein MRB53_022035 [Persea americana]